MGSELAPVVCPQGHRQAIRLVGEEAVRLRPFLSFRCPTCKAIFAGRVVAYVVVSATHLTVARET